MSFFFIIFMKRDETYGEPRCASNILGFPLSRCSSPFEAMRLAVRLVSGKVIVLDLAPQERLYDLKQLLGRSEDCLAEAFTGHVHVNRGRC